MVRLAPPRAIGGRSRCCTAVPRQIRFILLQNRQGRTRLAKYYVPLDDGEKRKLEFDIHRLVVNRDPKFTNFLEVRPRAAAARCSDGAGAASPFGAAVHSALRSAALRQRAPPPLRHSPAPRGRASVLHEAARALRQKAQCSTLAHKSAASSRRIAVAQFRTHKVIYRRYAGLFFSMCVDTTGASPSLCGVPVGRPLNA